jgi:hypothetical protein
MHHLVAEVGVRVAGELDAGVGAGELPPAGDPVDGGPFVEEEHRGEVLHAFLHDQLHAQHLAFVVVGDQLRRQDLDHGIGVLLLWVCREEADTLLLISFATSFGTDEWYWHLAI